MYNFLELNNTDDFTYLINSIGQDVLINKQPVKAMITNTDLHRIYDERKITTLHNIQTGDLVQFNNRDWLIHNEVNGQRYGKYKALIRACDYNIKFNFNGNIKEFPSCVDGKFFDLDTGKYINLSADQIIVTVQENEDTLKVKVDDRFIKLGSAWSISGINRTVKGLITFTCTQTQFRADDDIENEIADGKKYYVRITNTKPIEIDEGSNVKLTYEATTGMNVSFTVSDSSIATVDNTGLVTGLRAGTVIITAKLGDSSFIDTIKVIINEAAIEKSIVITGASEIKFNQTVSWSAKVMQGTDELPDIVTWSLWNDAKSGTTNLATINSINGNSVTLKAASTVGYIQLKAQYLDVEAWLRIQVKSLF